MDFITILTSIVEHGILPVIVGVILYIVWTRSSNSEKRKQQEADAKREAEKLEAEAKKEQEKLALEAQREAQMLQAISEIIKQSKNLPHTVESENTERKLDDFKKDQLDCMITHGCDRGYIFTFHNGCNDIYGRGFQKMSITQESIRGCRAIMKDYQNVPRQLFPNLYKKLYDQGYYYVEDIEDIKDSDPMTYSFLSEHGAKAAYFQSIKNNDEPIYGFVGEEYNTLDFDKEVAKQVIQRKTYRIAGAVSLDGNN